MCRKQPGIAIGRLCDKCDGKCPVCDSYVRPTTLVRICDECSFGNYQNKCVVCGGEVFFSPYPTPQIAVFRGLTKKNFGFYFRGYQTLFTALNVHGWRRIEMDVRKLLIWEVRERICFIRRRLFGIISLSRLPPALLKSFHIILLHRIERLGGRGRVISDFTIQTLSKTVSKHCQSIGKGKISKYWVACV